MKREVLLYLHERTFTDLHWYIWGEHFCNEKESTARDALLSATIVAVGLKPSNFHNDAPRRHD